MGYVLQDRTTQPAKGEIVRIDTAKSITRGLKSVWYNDTFISRGHNSTVDSVSKGVVIQQPGVGQGRGLFAVVANYIILPTNAFSQLPNCSLFGLVKIGPGTSQTFFGGGASGAMTVRSNNNVDLQLVARGVAVVATGTGVLALNEVCTVTGVYEGTGAILYKNGVQVAINTSTTINPATSAEIGADGTSGTRGSGYVFLMLAYERALQAAEIAYLHKNPWVVLEPELTYQLKPSGGGGGTVYTLSPGGSFTLSGSASLLRERAIVPSGSIAFSGTAALLRTRVLQPSGSVTFSGSASLVRNRIISPTGQVVFSGSAPITFTPAGGSTIIPQRTVVGTGT